MTAIQVFSAETLVITITNLRKRVGIFVDPVVFCDLLG